jgi:galactosylceramidase
MPYYGVDIAGVFEVVDRPDGRGKCLRQVVDRKVEGWVGSEWAPSTVLGDNTWSDYEVSVDVSFDSRGWAGVMGRVTSLDNDSPKGYYLRLGPDGAWGMYAMVGGSKDDGRLLHAGQVALSSGAWHNLKLQLSGSTITGYIENRRVFSTTDASYSHGMAGLVTAGPNGVRSTALFDNLIINTVNGPKPRPTVFSQDANPPYPPAAVARKPAGATQPHRSEANLPHPHWVGTENREKKERFTGFQEATGKVGALFIEGPGLLPFVSNRFSGAASLLSDQPGLAAVCECLDELG